MLEQMTVLKQKKGEREYILLIPSDAPTGELFDVLCDFKGFTYEIIQENIKMESEISAKEMQTKIKIFEENYDHK